MADEQTLRRKIAATKSYLSRLDNQRNETLRSSREGKMEEFRRLTDKRDAQYFKFREVCTQLRKYDELES